MGKIMAENTREHKQLFDEEIRMWVVEEQVNGKKLTEIINTEHENVS
jgi:glycerol-3-phosphate dehydrogenase (NAD+)